MKGQRTRDGEMEQLISVIKSIIAHLFFTHRRTFINFLGWNCVERLPLPPDAELLFALGREAAEMTFSLAAFLPPCPPMPPRPPHKYLICVHIYHQLSWNRVTFLSTFAFTPICIGRSTATWRCALALSLNDYWKGWIQDIGNTETAILLSLSLAIRHWLYYAFEIEHRFGYI